MDKSSELVHTTILLGCRHQEIPRFWSNCPRTYPIIKKIMIFGITLYFLTKIWFFLKVCGILVNISDCRAFSPFEIVPGSPIRNVQFPSCRQPSDIKVCTGSENLSPKKPNKFLESLDIPSQTFDILKKFERTFRRKLRENFWLPDI